MDEYGLAYRSNVPENVGNYFLTDGVLLIERLSIQRVVS